MSQQAFTVILTLVAQILITLSGISLVIAGMFPGLKRLTLRLLLAGILIAVYAGSGYESLPMQWRSE